MAYITDQETVFGIEEVVVFEISRHQGMDPGLAGIFEEETSRATADRNFLYRSVRQGGMPDHGSSQGSIQGV